MSSVSSLGLLSLGNVEDIQEYLASKKFNDDSMKSQRNSIVNEKLEMQRLLAQKAIDRIDSKTKLIHQVGGLPAYLLEPSNQTPGIF